MKRKPSEKKPQWTVCGLPQPRTLTAKELQAQLKNPRNEAPQERALLDVIEARDKQAAYKDLFLDKLKEDVKTAGADAFSDRQRKNIEGKNRRDRLNKALYGYFTSYPQGHWASALDHFKGEEIKGKEKHYEEKEEGIKVSGSYVQVKNNKGIWKKNISMGAFKKRVERMRKKS